MKILKHIESAVSVGPYRGVARAPFWLAHGPERSADDLPALHRDADALQALFWAAPTRQWGAVAQAAMSYRGQWP